jgi:hypothetical protein
MPSTPEEQLASMIANLKEKTGRSLADWVKLATASGKAKHGEIVGFLKEKHGLGHGYANLVAQRTLNVGVPEASGDDLVEAQYSGAKSALRPIYEALASRVKAFGADVELSPKEGYVSLRRSKQFGLIQPSTATRLDVGINLKGTPPSGRLEASGSFNAMVTHRVRLESVKDVDAELTGWLKKAYEVS